MRRQGRIVVVDAGEWPTWTLMETLEAIVASSDGGGGCQKRRNVASTWGPGRWDGGPSMTVTSVSSTAAPAEPKSPMTCR